MGRARWTGGSSSRSRRTRTQAWCDGPQQLYARDFAAFAKSVADHAALEGMALA